MAEGSGEMPRLSEEGVAAFTEGVRRCLGRWTALQLAVENEWGGSRSNSKAHDFHSGIVNWMLQSREPRYIDELESLLDDNMLSLFNAEIEDGSLEEVAEQIMLLHEECLEGNYGRLELFSASSGAKESVYENQKENSRVDETGHDAAEFSRLSSENITEAMAVDRASEYTTVPGTGFRSNDGDIGNVKQCLTADEVANGWQVVAKGKHRNIRK